MATAGKDLDEVSRNQIWREHLAKEIRDVSLLEKPYTLSHPKKLAGLPEKPTKLDPRVAVSPSLSYLSISVVRCRPFWVFMREACGGPVKNSVALSSKSHVSWCSFPVQT